MRHIKRLFKFLGLVLCAACACGETSRVLIDNKDYIIRLKSTMESVEGLWEHGTFFTKANGELGVKTEHNWETHDQYKYEIFFRKNENANGEKVHQYLVWSKTWMKGAISASNGIEVLDCCVNDGKLFVAYLDVDFNLMVDSVPIAEDVANRVPETYLIFKTSITAGPILQRCKILATAKGAFVLTETDYKVQLWEVKKPTPTIIWDSNEKRKVQGTMH